MDALGGSSIPGRPARLALRWAVAALVVASAAAAHGCGRRGTAARVGDPSAPQVDNAGDPAPAVPFEVRRESTDVTFFWFDARGTAHAVSRIEDVPEASRETVRVDPSRPELRAPGWVYVADLRAAGADGRFRVRAIASEDFANQLASVNGLAAAMAQAPAPPPGAGAPQGTPAVLQPAPAGSAQNRVVIYGASWCSACHQAAAWLRAQHIPFVELDIEADPAAREAMTTRARQQGVPTGSIPIIDVAGRLMVGFNPEAIQQALRAGG